MHGDARDLARGVEPVELGAGVDVRVDAAHVVVGARPDRDRLVDRVDAGEHHRQLARAVQPLEDPLGAEVAQVEQHVAVEPAALVDLGLLGARDHVARGELHRLRRIVLAGSARRSALSRNAPSPRQPSVISTPVGASVVGWNCIISMSFSGTPDAERHRHPVAGARVRVRGADVQPARPAGGEDRRPSPRAPTSPPRSRSQAITPAHAAAVLDELPGEVLLVDADAALHDLLVERLDQDVPGDVGRVDGALHARGAERPLRDPPVLGAREDRAPVLELVEVGGRLVAEDLDRVLVAEVVGALDRVERLQLRAVRPRRSRAAR